METSGHGDHSGRKRK
ncbi:hypothetical protein CIB84_005714 [Bambusicola thoracicus]|uniref:Uncharacterized protein n=1 Tax=Bambusicola thoracicus TaxID=9083 RepID=A0A2P4T2D8_BAMTH|nr:hypothetical protein CIB84_005714 [Bambusicola thoracicus]